MFHLASKNDVPAIVELLADDLLGTTREKVADPLPESYYAAFQSIEEDPNQELWILRDQEKVIGTFQLSILPYLTYKGTTRALLEAVRVHVDYRGQGLGKKLIEWAIERAKIRGAGMFQLTSNKQRKDALRFYESLGFEASHEGLKLIL